MKTVDERTKSSARTSLPFDRLAGASLDAVPLAAGVYRFVDADGVVVYVGKATNLRRRLSQYRRARRRKKHWKMRAIVRDAVGVTIEVSESVTAAELREAELIAQLRPRWNVAGAFSFLYPCIGIGGGADSPAARAPDVPSNRARSATSLVLAYSTVPSERPDLAWHGAFRSRDLTREAFYALIRLLSLIGHSAAVRGSAPRGRTRTFEIRQLPGASEAAWTAFLRGESRRALEQLAVALLEKPRARRLAARVQEDLRAVDRFFRCEAGRLRRACDLVGDARWPIPQTDRDALFIKARRAAVGDRICHRG